MVGHTGAGKTTLISLLLRFYDVQQGQHPDRRQSISGSTIRWSCGSMFGVVLQDPYLFTGTLEDNIRLGTEGITRRGDRARGGAGEPDGLHRPLARAASSSRCGSAAAGFSTGQKQLISFARALAHNPRFLILDEATSSVDTETEFRVRDALDRMVEGRTSIVIAHRLSTIQRADRILVMHKGQLREAGTHQELLAHARDLLEAVSVAVQGPGSCSVR